jgi:hypothetical protein
MNHPGIVDLTPGIRSLQIHVDGKQLRLEQAERLVECLEADAWSGGVGDLATFGEVYAAACTQSGVAPLLLDEQHLARLRAGMQELARQWAGGSYRFTF